MPLPLDRYAELKALATSALRLFLAEMGPSPTVGPSPTRGLAQETPRAEPEQHGAAPILGPHGAALAQRSRRVGAFLDELEFNRERAIE